MGAVLSLTCFSERRRRRAFWHVFHILHLPHRGHMRSTRPSILCARCGLMGYHKKQAATKNKSDTPPINKKHVCSVQCLLFFFFFFFLLFLLLRLILVFLLVALFHSRLCRGFLKALQAEPLEFSLVSLRRLGFQASTRMSLGVIA